MLLQFFGEKVSSHNFGQDFFGKFLSTSIESYEVYRYICHKASRSNLAEIFKDMTMGKTSHFPNQEDMNGLVRYLSISKSKAEMLISRLEDLSVEMRKEDKKKLERDSWTLL